MEVFRQITANNIELKNYPFLKELAMEAYLMENEDILKLDTGNFADVTVLDAEIALKSGRKTSNRDGRIDILAKYGLDYLALIELKINELNEQSLYQLEDYLDERHQILNKHPEFWAEVENEPNWIGVLVGSSISPELQRKLQDGYTTINGIPIAGMTLRRFRSAKNEIFVITDTFFKYNYTSRDFSKFEFKGEVYNKARLVNKVVRAGDIPGCHHPLSGVYGASKAAVNMYTVHLAYELRNTPLKVNAVCPGYTKTDFTGYQGGEIEKAGRRIVKYALIDEHGSTGKIFSEETNPATGEIPW